VDCLFLISSGHAPLELVGEAAAAGGRISKIAKFQRVLRFINEFQFQNQLSSVRFTSQCDKVRGQKSNKRSSRFNSFII